MALPKPHGFSSARRVLAALALLALATSAGASPGGISNIRLQEDGRRVVVLYDLDSPGPVSVALIGSGDGGATYHLKVTGASGDIGDAVVPGKDRKVVWDSSRDYPLGLAAFDVVLDVVLGPTAPARPRYFVIPVRGEVGWEITRKTLEKALAASERERPDAVVLEVDSPGGSIAELTAIIDLLVVQQGHHPSTRLVAFVQDKALSAAAILSLTCRDIVMRPGSTMGAAMAIQVNQGKVTGVEEKFSSAYRAKARAATEAGGHEPLIAEAMIDPTMELWVHTDGGRPAVARTRPAKQDAGSEPKLLDPADKLLTLTPAEALESGVIRGIASDYAEAGRALGLDGWVEVGDAGRTIVGAQEAEAARIMGDYEELVLEVKEGLDRLRKATSTRSAASSNIWSIRKAVDEIDQLAAEYPSIAFRVGMQFPGGVAQLRDECDRVLDRLR